MNRQLLSTSVVYARLSARWAVDRVFGHSCSVSVSVSNSESGLTSMSSRAMTHCLMTIGAAHEL